MSVPTLIFIDTNVFDSTQYNFQAASLQPLYDVLMLCGFTLLMPDPVYKEIRRHIGEKSSKAAKAFVSLGGPIMRKLPEWSKFEGKKNELKNILFKAVWDDFVEFGKRFDEVKEIGYGGVNLEEIIAWRDELVPPFSLGKNDEFPDAITVAMLAEHYSNHNRKIAVISHDRDFEDACKRYPYLLHFSSVGAFCERVVGGNEKVLEWQKSVGENIDGLKTAIEDAFHRLSFQVMTLITYDVVSVGVTNMDEIAYYVSALGENEATVSFDCTVKFSAKIWFPSRYPAVTETTINQDFLAMGIVKVSKSNGSIAFQEASLDDEVVYIFENHGEPDD